MKYLMKNIKNMFLKASLTYAREILHKFIFHGRVSKEKNFSEMILETFLFIRLQLSRLGFDEF